MQLEKNYRRKMAKDNDNTGLLHNVIAQGTRINGTIETNSDIRFDGVLDGNLTCQGKVVIGQQGAITGDIICNNADIMGTVEGIIKVSDTLSLKSTAVISGEIHTKILSIEPNAVFNGTCEMLRRE